MVQGRSRESRSGEAAGRRNQLKNPFAGQCGVRLGCGRCGLGPRVSSPLQGALLSRTARTALRLFQCRLGLFQELHLQLQF